LTAPEVARVSQHERPNEGLEGSQALEEIIGLILRHKPDLTRDKVLEMVEERIRDLGGLIDEDAAAMLVAKELGVPLPKAYIMTRGARLRVKDLLPGLRGLKLVARVLRVPHPLALDSGRKVLKVLIGDESGVINLVVWDERAEELYEGLRPGMCILIEGGFAKKYKGRLELGLAKEGRIEVLDEECGIPSLEELCSKHGISVITVKVCEVVEGGGGRCIYGLHSDKPVQVLIPDELEAPSLRAGDTVILQDARELKGDAARFRVNRMTRVFVVTRGEPLQSPFKLLDVDEARSADKSTLLGIRGLLVAALPSRRGAGGSLILAGRLSSASILSFEDEVIAKLGQIRPATPIELRGIYSSGARLRLNPYSSFEVTGEPPLKDTPADSLAVGSGYVSCKATVISCRIKYRLAESGEPLLGIVMNVDDGTGRARVLVSYKAIICRLLRSEWEELREYAATGLMPKLIPYLEEELLGSDVLLRGWLSEDGVMAVVEAEVVSG